MTPGPSSEPAILPIAEPGAELHRSAKAQVFGAVYQLLRLRRGPRFATGRAKSKRCGNEEKSTTGAAKIEPPALFPFHVGRRFDNRLGEFINIAVDVELHPTQIYLSTRWHRNGGAG